MASGFARDFSCSAVFILRRGKGIRVAAGDDDGFGENPVKPPGLVQPAKHGFGDSWELYQTARRDGSAGQDHDGVIRLGLVGIDERRVA